MLNEVFIMHGKNKRFRYTEDDYLQHILRQSKIHSSFWNIADTEIHYIVKDTDYTYLLDTFDDIRRVFFLDDVSGLFNPRVKITKKMDKGLSYLTFNYTRNDDNGDVYNISSFFNLRNIDFPVMHVSNNFIKRISVQKGELKLEFNFTHKPEINGVVFDKVDIYLVIPGSNGNKHFRLLEDMIKENE